MVAAVDTMAKLDTIVISLQKEQNLHLVVYSYSFANKRWNQNRPITESVILEFSLSIFNVILVSLKSSKKAIVQNFGYPKTPFILIISSYTVVSFTCILLVLLLSN